MVNSIPGRAAINRLTGLWRHPDFLRLWAAETVSQFGSQITLVALPLIAALTLDASPGEMGLLAAASGVPFLAVGLFAGVWVDRLRRRPILIASDLGRAVLLLAIPAAWALDALRMELLYAVAVLTGTLTLFFDVAYASFLPTLVRRDQLLEGNSKLQASASVAQVGGPGLGGALVGLVSAPFAILVDAGSFLASAIFIRRIRTAEPAPERPAARPPVWSEIGEGLRAVLGNPMLRAMAAASACTNLFGYAFLAVYVLYMTEDLGLGATAVGLVFAAGGLGAFLGALLAEPAARRLGVGPAMVWGQLLCGLGGMVVPIAVLAPGVALPLVVFAEFFQWMMLVIYFVNALSLRQALTPDRLQGRVNATMRFLIAGSQPIGSLLGGLIGELFGVQYSLVIGVMGMLAAFVWLLLSPLRTLRRPPEPETHVEPVELEPALA